MAVLGALLSACGYSDTEVAGRDRSPQPGASAGSESQTRNVDEMMRAKFHHQQCDADGDCPFGTHCDDGAGACDYTCIADDACDSGARCNDLGVCVPSFTRFIATTAPECASQSRADIIAALELLNDDPNKCHADTDCICGAYCNTDSGFCQVDCVDGSTSGNLVCPDAADTCSTVGRCVAGGETVPSPQLVLDLSPDPVSADSYSAPVLVPVTVAVDAVSVDVLTAVHPATVRYHFVGIDDPAQPGNPDLPPPDPATFPKVKCASGDTLATSCQIDGGWTFDVVNHDLHSAPRTIWVQLPQSTTSQTWTLQATSEWAADATSITVIAAPVVPSPPIPGHYQGSLTLTLGGIPTATKVDALVTSTTVAVIEPTNVFLPDGHAVFARDATKVTMLGWLSSGTSRYDVRVALGAAVQTAATGHLEFPNSTLTMGTGAVAPLALSLDRTGDLDAAACTSNSTCGTGSYCDGAISLCLPGTGPASGAGIVNATATNANPSVTLPSAQVASWNGPLTSLVQSNPSVLGFTGSAGIEAAYCARSPLDGAPSQFGISPVLAGSPGQSGASLDRQCNLAGTPYLETTFPYAELQKEVIPGAQGGADFVLVDTCTTELNDSPTTVLQAKQCVSLGRFFLALKANAGSDPGPDYTQRLIGQVLRQWLGVNTYVASTTVRSQAYHDVLDADTVTAAARLGQAVDRMEQSLLVLLDPTVRPQLANELPSVVTRPDYRAVQRPIVRWTFNQGTLAVPDVEGTNTLNVSSSVPGEAFVNGELVGTGALTNTRTALSNAEVAVVDENPGQDSNPFLSRNYAVVFKLRYVPLNGVVVSLFEKFPSATGDEIDLAASTTDGGHHLNLFLAGDGVGNATFVIPYDPINGAIIALSSDRGNMVAYSALPGQAVATAAATISTSGGVAPVWSPGQLQLFLDANNDGSCTSWDHDAVGDGLGVGWIDHSSELSATQSYTCHIIRGHATCQGHSPSGGGSFCAATATARRNALIAAMWPNAPQTYVGQLAVSGTYNLISQGSEPGDPGESNTWTNWDCALSIDHLPFAKTEQKPVCGPIQSANIAWDEFSIWDRPIQLREFGDMVARYGNNKLNETLPPRSSPDLDGNEQRAGLPVYLVEAANAQLDLLTHYLDADDAVVYSQCYAGGDSAERPIATAKAGRNLRLISVIEAEAARLAAVAKPSASWLPRYQLDLQQLAKRHADVLRALGRIAGCENTLGISDDEIPLYVGQGKDTSPTSRFFAASQYLASLAENETLTGHGTVDLLLSQARASYVSQRLSSFQTNRGAGSTEKTDRVNALDVNYEDQLKRYCGSAPGDASGGHPLLDSFIAGTMTSSNCFFKLELTKCKALEGTAFGNVPDDCVRGEIGERIIAIKSAAVDADNASRAFDRASRAWDDAVSYCDKVQHSVDQGTNELKHHQDTMHALTEERSALAVLGGISKLVSAVGAAAASGGAGAPGVLGAIGEAEAGVMGAALDARTEEENAKYQAEVSARQGDDAVMACKHTADQQRFSIAAADDTTKRAAQESVAALFAIHDAMSSVDGIAGEAKAQIALEDTLDRTPPQFHYWLDQNIAEYDKHMAYARRLTYLALRAYEYEAQTDTGLREAVLTARLPKDLEDVVTFVKNKSAPFAGGGIDAKAIAKTFSLRDEIMKLQAVPNVDPTKPPLKTAPQAFNDLLLSTPVYSGTGAGRHLFGYGIRFTVKPGEVWNDVLCDERIWRITPLVTVTGTRPADTTVTLQQSNSFGRQTCTAEPVVNMTRIRQNGNLLQGDEPATFATPPAAFSTPILLDRSVTVEQLQSFPDTDSRLDPSMAGRGIYGDYVLVVPLCDPARGCTTGYTMDMIKNVTDVQLRMDIAAGGNSHVVVVGP